MSIFGFLLGIVMANDWAENLVEAKPRCVQVADCSKCNKIICFKVDHLHYCCHPREWDYPEWLKPILNCNNRYIPDNGCPEFRTNLSWLGSVVQNSRGNQFRPNSGIKLQGLNDNKVIFELQKLYRLRHIDCNFEVDFLMGWDFEGCEPNWTWEPWMTDDSFWKV